MAVRTFLALPLDEGIVARLVKAQQRLMTVDAHVRWVEPENLHLTVKFLGVVEDRQMHEVCTVARDIVAQVEAFEFAIGGLSAAPPAGQIRMVWAGIEDPTGWLGKLNALCEQAYAELGFKQENRQFRPHLTLGRVKTGRNVPELRAAVREFADTDFGVQPADEVIVFSSDLTPDGPLYEPLATLPLK